MRRMVYRIGRRIAAGTAASLCLAACAAPCLQAEEASGYYDEYGNWVQDAWSGENPDPYAAGDFYADGDPYADAEQTEQAAAMTGTYSVDSGWVVDSVSSTEDKTVYKQEGCVDLDYTSTISCSYLDTNYSVLEYEQLRDMLTNNLLYNNVNAQISTSASYTQAKDYLYIVIVDDTSQEYKDIYHYVVGDYRCFCVEVHQNRAEADAAAAEGRMTPQEVGQSTAEGFTWSMTDTLY